MFVQPFSNARTKVHVDNRYQYVLTLSLWTDSDAKKEKKKQAWLRALNHVYIINICICPMLSLIVYDF